LGLEESEQIFNFKDASANEYGSTFILSAISGDLNTGTDDLNNRFDDSQKWQIQIAFPRSSQNDSVERDEAHSKREAIIKDLDNSINTTFVKTMRYDNWAVDDLPNYFLVKINFSVVDRITY
jgi:hypothetical protein